MKNFQNEVMMSMFMINQLSFSMNPSSQSNNELKSYFLNDIKKFEDQSQSKGLKDEKFENLNRLLKRGKMLFEWVEWARIVVKTQLETNLRNGILPQNMISGMILQKSLISSQVRRSIQSMFLIKILNLTVWKIHLDNHGTLFRENRK